MLYAGYSIIETEMVGEPVIKTRIRTWKERIFTLPWQPRKKIASYTIYRPKGEFILDTINKVIYGHPADVYNLKVAIMEKEGERDELYNYCRYA
jgi:hypothetical protein